MLAHAPPPTCRAREHELRGLTALEPSDALDAFEAAAERPAGCSRRAAVASALGCGRGRTACWSSRSRGLAHLLVAERGCLALGLVPLGRRVDRSLRALDRVTPSARRSGLFSAAELRVLHGVASGLTTKQITRYLALKPSTVESHIRAAVMRATGATTAIAGGDRFALETLEPPGAARAVSFVTRDDDALSEGVDRLRRDGATIVSWDAMPPEPWTLSDADMPRRVPSRKPTTLRSQCSQRSAALGSSCGSRMTHG